MDYIELIIYTKYAKISTVFNHLEYLDSDLSTCHLLFRIASHFQIKYMIIRYAVTRQTKRLQDLARRKRNIMNYLVIIFVIAI